ncbi:MAG: hypothetical protein K2K26_10095, partial [Muribaculaceae bacterium]|nr:hypothetical protein [Muribaculaceae bacterium]MDE6670014.1 hypothetical protein [Muribaculaceae bacterium]
NGRTVKKTEKVPVNAAIVVEVYDGRLGALRDSLQTAEYVEYAMQERAYQETEDSYNTEPVAPAPAPKPKPEPAPDLTEEEETDNYLNQ